jgi:hypothetical protein
VIAWHYTAGHHLPEILRSGALYPAGRDGYEPDAVWFSLRRDWDPAVGLGVQQPSDATAEAVARWISGGGARAAVAHLASSVPRVSPASLGGVGRIGVRPDALLTWEEYVRLCRLPPWYARMRVELDSALGSNPPDWRISVSPVPAREWIAVQHRSGTATGERWEPVQAERRG